jgi:4-amino-4-deoxy-L-arabinose transferase-like glycosyltransferase
VGLGSPAADTARGRTGGTSSIERRIARDAPLGALYGALLAWMGIVAVLSWRLSDADEFANLQQALRLASGAALYVQTPASHPPLYPVLLLPAAWAGGSLAVARALSVGMLWGAGVLTADALRRRAGKPAALAALVLWSLAPFVLFAGSRAMNEVPVLFFVTLSAWLLIADDATARRWGWVAGVLLAAAFLTRYTTVVAATPLLALGWHRIRGAAAAGAATLGATAIVLVTAVPVTAGHLIEESVVYQLARQPMDAWIRFVGVLALGLGPALAIASLARPVSLREPGLLRRMAAIGLAACLAMLAVPVIHFHYFLPFASLAVAVLAVTVQRLLPAHRLRAAAVLLAWFLLNVGQVVPYAMGSTVDLAQATTQAEAVAAIVPHGSLILTDAPQLPVLAGRTNLDGYYWSLANDPPFAAASVDRVALVVDGAPGETDRLPASIWPIIASWPCGAVANLPAWWNPAAGPPPDGFRPGCDLRN